MKLNFPFGTNIFKATVALVVSTLFLSGTAAAAPLNIINIVGGWLNPVGAASVTISNAADQGMDTIRWSDGTPPDSGYNFTPGSDILGVAMNTNILLGNMVHVNQPILSGSSITSVDYDLSFAINGIPASLMMTLMFTHNETPNGADPCADGGTNNVGVNINGCADIVTIALAVLNVPILVGTDTFFFNLLGFSLDGGTTFSNQFKSEETGSNTALLYGTVGLRIPEPTTLAIFAFGLASLGFMRREWQRQSKS